MLMLSMAYWYLGNRQMFYNEYEEVEENSDEITDANHNIWDFS